jgi:hypothetical protein
LFVRVYSVCVVLCVGRGLATDLSPVQGVLRTVNRTKKLKSCQNPTEGCKTIDKQRDRTTFSLQFLPKLVTLYNSTIKRTLNSGNACYHSVQKLMSSRLLSKNIKIRIYKTVILPVVLYGCETWSLTLGKEHRLRMFENRVLRRIFGPKRDGMTGDWMKLLMRNFITCIPRQT